MLDCKARSIHNRHPVAIVYLETFEEEPNDGHAGQDRLFRFMFAVVGGG